MTTVMAYIRPPTRSGSMSELGQTEKNSLRADVFRVIPESGHCSMQSACLKGANTESSLLIRSPHSREPLSLLELQDLRAWPPSLIASSTLVGCTTGRSGGSSTERIRSAYFLFADVRR